MSTNLLTRETLRGSSGGVWQYLSPSRLSCWLACPLKWKLRYLDRIQLPTSPAMFLGKMCHSGLEIYYRHRMLGVTLDGDDIARRMEESWGDTVTEERMEFESSNDEQAVKRQTADLVGAYLAHIPEDEPCPMAVEVAMESPLVDPITGEDLGIPLLGIVDLILDGGDGATVVDFKTAGRSSAPLEISHEIQLTSYAWLFRQVSDRPESQLQIRSLIKTKVPQIKFHRYPARTENDLRRLFAVIREYLDAIDCGRFNYRPGWGCSMCDYRETHCRRWCG